MSSSIVVVDQPVPWNWETRRPANYRENYTMLRLAVYSIASLFLGPFGLYQDGISKSSVYDLTPHCNHVPPISKAEFDSRQAALSSELHRLNALAYVAEPSPNSQFFANFSSANWKLSERPLLLIVRPRSGKSEADIQPDVTILTPTVSLPCLLTQDTTHVYIFTVRDS